MKLGKAVTGRVKDKSNPAKILFFASMAQKRWKCHCQDKGNVPIMAYMEMAPLFT